MYHHGADVIHSMSGVTPIQNGDHLQYEIDNAGVPKELRSDWPMPSFYALDWAKAFSKRHPSVSVEDALPWMACALMRGYDEHASRQKGTDVL